jgi:hypothetical protein
MVVIALTKEAKRDQELRCKWTVSWSEKGCTVTIRAEGVGEETKRLDIAMLALQYSVPESASTVEGGCPIVDGLANDIVACLS